MKHDEKGIALVITLFLMATLSALAVSMMFLAQTETASSKNYRTMSQARYAAEAGLQQMSNYLMYTYTAPASPYTGYDTTKSPITCTSGCSHTTTTSCTPTTVALAVSTGCIVVGYSSATSNNPAGTVNSGGSGTMAVNSSGSKTNAAAGTVTYGVAAILMSMRPLTPYGSSTASVVQTWQIISDGTVPPSTAAIVEVSGYLEREFANAQTFAVFATNPNCAAITISGNASTNSYNSTSSTDMSTTPPTATGGSGGIGTNGNLDVGGSVAIGGTLSTPRTGAGTCTASNPNAITGVGSWTYGGTVHLPQALAYPTPTVPTGVPTTSTTISSSLTTAACTALVSASGWSCLVNSITNTVTLTPIVSTNVLTLGNLTVGANTNLVIGGGSTQTVNVNSFNIGSNATMSMATATSVTMNIAGQSLGSTKPLDLSGGGTVNPSYDPSRLQIIYAGTAEMDLVGNNTIAATIYAPNAQTKTTGHGSLYGSVLSSTFTDTGGAHIDYDTNLMTKYQTLGNFMLTSFSWKKY